MSTTLSVNGVSFAFPVTGETTWGNAVTAWAQAVSTSTLQKNGGTFTLTADTDFGSGFGLKSLYYKSRSATPASAGTVRLGNTELIEWRNNANNADLTLGVDTSSNLEYNGVDVTLASNSAPAVVTFGYTSSAADTTTRYSAPGGPNAAAGTTEFAMPVPYACKVSKMYLYAITAGAANCQFRVRKNGVDTSMGILLASGTNAAHDIINTATFAAGDLLSVSHTMASSTTCVANTTISLELTLV